MQVMLAAFIQMNTKNTSIQSVQADQIGRTYPPLFTLNLLKEEQIVDNLREITAMEYVVQVIMIIVSVAVVIIDMVFLLHEMQTYTYYIQILLSIFTHFMYNTYVPSLGPPSTLGGPCPRLCGHFRQFHVNMLWTCRHLFSDVTSSGGTMTSCVTSWLHMCTGHVIICYKRSALLALEALSSRPLVHPSGLPLSPMYSWCLMCVGHNTSSTSPSWSLLPPSVIIVLALVNSAVSHKGT